MKTHDKTSKTLTLSLLALLGLGLGLAFSADPAQADPPTRVPAAVAKAVKALFPKAAVVALPISNSTSEQLARWFGTRLREQLAERGATNVTSLAVGVEEMPGQAGWWREEIAVT